MPISYGQVVELIEANPSAGIFVPVFYCTGTYEWLPIDRQELLRQYKMISNPEVPFPCWVEVEHGDIFFHPKIENV